MDASSFSYKSLACLFIYCHIIERNSLHPYKENMLLENILRPNRRGWKRFLISMFLPFRVGCHQSVHMGASTSLGLVTVPAKGFQMTNHITRTRYTAAFSL